MFFKIIKFSFILIVLYLFINLVTPFSGFLLNRSIENQIHYIDKQLKNGADDDLQKRYPEGKIFSNSIFTLSLIEYNKKHSYSSNENSIVVDRCVQRLLEKNTSAYFPSNVNPQYGSFYNGWINLVLKSYIESSSFEFSKIKEQVLEANKQFEKRIANAQLDSVRILESYNKAYWPADNLVAIASLDDSLKNLKQQWLQKLLDESETNLIHHIGSKKHQIRGTSQSLIIYLTSLFDRESAQEFNKAFLDRLSDNFLGADLICEYEGNSDGYMDVDSGPIVFGYGSVATLMNVKTQAALANSSSKNTWALLNSISIPINLFGKKYYLFQQELMLDVFMLWAAVELE